MITPWAMLRFVAGGTKKGNTCCPSYPTGADGKPLPPIGDQSRKHPVRMWRKKDGISLEVALRGLGSIGRYKPAPRACDGHEGARVTECLGLSECLRVAAIFGWAALDCSKCPVHRAMEGGIEWWAL